MGDVSVLSHEYEVAANLAREINAFVIALKKIHERLPGADAVDPQALAQREAEIAGVVDALKALLESRPADVTVTSAIPGGLVQRLRDERRGDLLYFLEDLARIATRLRTHSDLEDADLRVLDQIAAAADAETSSVFRRMMRK